ncbi:hypothetical protein BCV35_018405 [Vibrio cyclitrophicus]|uniref:hypothetical protein n=1 Tax=Vibrio cyclitrophicus TaxID=47951 RepID=UPI000C841C6B|nr:hypothetical protein [Vibrio cyclitrophicus]PME52020.1 hypothetical protein BCV35_04995 [Vibrio cyclitrophicus]
MSTAEIGYTKVYQKIKRLSAIDVVKVKDGNKRYIIFTSSNGKRYTVTSRAKKSGTWQTSTNYGVARSENLNETNFWVFVDISLNEPVFYIAPLWWVENDIHLAHSTYLQKHNGQRAQNNNSTHHSISKKRIKKWEEAWNVLGLNA